MASPGNGTSGHLSGELFKMMAGVDMVHVPYRGAAPALTDLLGGQVQAYFSTLISSIQYIRDGKLRPLAVSGATLILLRRFSASQFWEHVQHYDATQFNFIGAMARMLYNQPPTPLDAAHRVRIACGAPVPVDIAADFERRFHLINSSGAIFDDHISSRLFYFYPRNLLADRRAWSCCHGDCPDPILVPSMDGTDYCLFLST
jgi:hypothetical protein